ITAASTTWRTIGPGTSKDSASGTIPERDAMPRVVLRPTSEFSSDGLRIEPDVSVPIVAAASASDAATPDPLLDPEGSPPLYALTTWPPSELNPFGIPVAIQLANSDRLVLPRMIAPAARSRLVMKA